MKGVYHSRMDIFQEFSNSIGLSVHSDVSKIVIKEYQGSTILVEGKNISKQAKISEKNGILYIEDRDDSWDFSLGLFNKNRKITIQVPINSQFTSTDIKVGAGSVTINDLKTETLAIAVDAGNIDINTLDGQNLKFKVKTGDILARLTGSQEDYRYRVMCEVGSMEIGNVHINGISAKEQGGSGSRYIEAKCQVGRIKIEMEG